MPAANEIEIFESACRNKLAISVRGPTGCGKTRFMAYMAWRPQLPLITVCCHDDPTASDLIGRYLITGNRTVWIDGRRPPPCVPAYYFRGSMCRRRSRAGPSSS